MKILATLLATIACALPAAAQDDETAKSFHLLPHLADGGGSLVSCKMSLNEEFVSHTR